MDEGSIERARWIAVDRKFAELTEVLGGKMPPGPNDIDDTIVSDDAEKPGPFNQDDQGQDRDGGDDESVEQESETGTNQVSEPDEPVSEEPSLAEVIILRMTELGEGADQMTLEERNTKLRDIHLGVGELPETDLGKFASFLIANGSQFEPRVLHFTVKCLVACHPVVLAQYEPLPGNVLGGIARKLIEGRYTWDNLVVHPPRVRPESEPEPEPDPASSSDEQSTEDDQGQDHGDGDGGGDEPQSESEPDPDPEPDPALVPEPSGEDPILATLRRQNAEMAALGF